MQLLNIFHTGGLTLALTIVWLLVAGWLFYQSYQSHNSPYEQDNRSNGGSIDRIADKTPWLKIPTFWGVIVWTVLYVVALIAVAISYQGV